MMSLPSSSAGGRSSSPSACALSLPFPQRWSTPELVVRASAPAAPCSPLTVDSALPTRANVAAHSNVTALLLSLQELNEQEMRQLREAQQQRLNAVLDQLGSSMDLNLHTPLTAAEDIPLHELRRTPFSLLARQHLALQGQVLSVLQPPTTTTPTAKQKQKQTHEPPTPTHIGQSLTWSHTTPLQPDKPPSDRPNVHPEPAELSPTASSALTASSIAPSAVPISEASSTADAFAAGVLTLCTPTGEDRMRSAEESAASHLPRQARVPSDNRPRIRLPPPPKLVSRRTHSTMSELSDSQADVAAVTPAAPHTPSNNLGVSRTSPQHVVAEGVDNLLSNWRCECSTGCSCAQSCPCHVTGSVCACSHAKLPPPPDSCDLASIALQPAYLQQDLDQQASAAFVAMSGTASCCGSRSMLPSPNVSVTISSSPLSSCCNPSTRADNTAAPAPTPAAASAALDEIIKSVTADPQPTSEPSSGGGLSSTIITSSLEPPCKRLRVNHASIEQLRDDLHLDVNTTKESVLSFAADHFRAQLARVAELEQRRQRLEIVVKQRPRRVATADGSIHHSLVLPALRPRDFADMFERADVPRALLRLNGLYVQVNRAYAQLADCDPNQFLQRYSTPFDWASVQSVGQLYGLMHLVMQHSACVATARDLHSRALPPYSKVYTFDVIAWSIWPVAADSPEFVETIILVTQCLDTSLARPDPKLATSVSIANTVTLDVDSFTTQDPLHPIAAALPAAALPAGSPPVTLSKSSSSTVLPACSSLPTTTRRDEETSARPFSGTHALQEAGRV